MQTPLRSVLGFLAAAICAATSSPTVLVGSGLSRLESMAPSLLVGSGFSRIQVPQQGEPVQATRVGGRWELNWQQSDKPPENFGAPGGGRGGDRGGPPGGPPPGGGGGMGGRGGGMGGRGGGMGGRGGQPADDRRSASAREEMQDLMQAPRTLLIVEHPDRVSITDENGRVHKLTPDGARMKEERGTGSIERRTSWDDRTLVTELTLDDGTKVTQTFQKVAEGLQLVVTTKVENKRFGRPLELRRVYDQALEVR